ncbi:MAG: pyridoxal phosphate-dependent aminotransferase [Thermoplasmata archaeon]|nr:MAG: pyridoxal phosphate-dependent aminotransferase [Thermoplasmata archaeon]
MPKPALSKIVEEQIKKPSPIRQIMKMAERKNIINMGLDPDDVISFGGGWVNHEAPEEFRKSYIQVCSDKKEFHKSGAYSATPGDSDLRDLIANYEKEIFGIKDLTCDNVIIGQSSTQVTHDTFICLADPGDAILLLDPTYANYPGQMDFALPNSKILHLQVLDPATWTYLPDVNKTIEDFKSIFSEHKPKLVLIPSPDNPSSKMIHPELLSTMRDVTKEAGSFLLIDHAYKTQYFGDSPPKYFSWSPSEHENLVTLHSNSKWARGLGRRLGWVEAAEHVIDGMERIQQCSILCPDSLHQMAMKAYLSKALEDGTLKQYVEEVRRSYEEAANTTISAIDHHLGKPRLEPDGGLYTVMHVGEDSDEFVLRVLKNTGVLFIPGKGFGESLKNGVRISYGPWVGNHEKIKEGMERVGKYLGKN